MMITSRIKSTVLMAFTVPLIAMAAEPATTKKLSAQQVKLNADVIAETQANRLFMQSFVEFINTADVKLASELVSPKAIFYVPGRAEPVSGPAGYLDIIHMMRSGFPDIQWTLEETVAEGDKVVARFTMRGTHLGAFFGVPASGKKIAVQALNIYRFAGGQIIEERGQPDLLDLMRQIGAIPK
ncbi:ester cyclase [Undibacterium sp. Ji83W]|uniref:ester cyclase n=1 Tax=Undibacterium sp. Ji83W TaxID=3413043 RepID=UPI003BF40DB6